jgi:hypothetical protein
LAPGEKTISGKRQREPPGAGNQAVGSKWRAWVLVVAGRVALMCALWTR